MERRHDDTCLVIARRNFCWDESLTRKGVGVPTGRSLTRRPGRAVRQGRGEGTEFTHLNLDGTLELTPSPWIETSETLATSRQCQIGLEKLAADRNLGSPRYPQGRARVPASRRRRAPQRACTRSCTPPRRRRASARGKAGTEPRRSVCLRRVCAAVDDGACCTTPMMEVCLCARYVYIQHNMD